MAVQTQIQTRRGTAASWTSTNPTLAAGEFGYETDTGKFKIGNGSTAWASLAYTAAATAVTYLFNATAAQTTFSGADANGLTLAYTVGAEQVYLNGVLQVRGSDYTATNGTSIVLASGALTSDVLNVIAYSAMTVTDTYTQAQADAKFFQTANAFLAGKNKIINGDFGIWQRGTSVTVGAGSWTYNTDRFSSYMLYSAGSLVVSRQTFTPGTAPVAGYEGQYFCRYTAPTTGTSELNFRQSIENVQTLAGQTATLSFWAKASASTSLQTKLTQDFGSGGSSRVDSASTTHSVTTSWARYTMTVTLASLAGKTIGTSSFLDAYFVTSSTFTSGATLDIWGVQLEAGSIATPFQTATGTLAGELAACQRYYYRANSAGAVYTIFALGYTDSATTALIMTPVPSYMRVFPTSINYANLAFQEAQGGIFTFTGISLNGGSGATAPNNNIQFQITGASGMTTGRPGRLLSNGVTNGHLGFSAEL